MAIAVSGGIVAVLAGLTDVDAARDRLASVDWPWIALAAGLGLLLPVVRARRFVVLLDGVGLGLATAVVGVHNLIARVTPFRAGELVLPYLLQRHAGAPASRTLVMLVWVRLLEVWILAGLLGVALVSRAAAPGLFVYVAAAFALLSVVLVRFGTWIRLALAIGRPLLRLTGLLRLAFVQKAWAALHEAADEMARLGWRRMIAAFAWSLLVWAVQLVIFGAILYGFGLTPTPLEVVLGVALAQLAAALPVASVGSVGVHEAGWVLGFTLVGVGRTDAVVTGVAAQALTLAFAAAVALPSWLHLRARPRPTAPGAPAPQ